MNLYRIISFESFIGLIENKEERYTRPIKWDDCYESYLLESLESAENRKKLIEFLYKNVSPNDPQTTINNFMKIWYAKWWTYAQCWSREKDSDAMWRIYNYHKHSIQICTNISRIQNLFKNNKYAFSRIDEVKYDVDDKTDIFEDQLYDLKKSLSVYEPYFHKRKAFEHEKEYRVIISDNSKQVMAQLCAWSASHDFKYRKNETRKPIDDLSVMIEANLLPLAKQKVEDNIYVRIGRLNEYITEVRVNPFAEEWYVKLVGEICKKNRIKFAGKSKLYTKKKA